MPPFFDYPKIIKKELESFYGTVYLEFSSPQNLIFKISSFFKIRRLKKYLISKNTKKIKKRLLKNAKEIDLIIVIKGSILSEDFYKWLKSEYSNANIVQYLWDNISTDPDAILVRDYFDRNFSFSYEDCEKYGFEYRPFFYSPLEIDINKSIDVACFASFSLDRAIILNKILQNNSYLFNRSLFIHLKGSNILFFKYSKYIKLLKPYTHTFGISYLNMMRILGKSIAQIDIPHPNQSGLTTRAFEALWTKTKIITTNSQIRNYDFYNETNILIIDRNNPEIKSDWLKQPYKDLPEEIKKRYSINSFISDLIGKTNNFNI